MRVKIPYLIPKPGRNNSTRWFWQPSTRLRRQGWKLVRLSDDEAEAVKEARQINASLAAWRKATPGDAAKIEIRQPGTIGGLIMEYKQSRFWRNLRPKTHEDYDYAFRAIERWAADAPVRSITAPLVQHYYESMVEDHPSKANSIVRKIRILMNYAIKRGYIQINPAAKPGLVATGFTGRLWSPQAVRAFVQQADAEGLHSLGTAVMLNEWLGQRAGDLISLPRSIYRDGAIRFQQSKKTAEVNLPVDMVPGLRQRLTDELKRQDDNKIVATTLLVNEQTGRPYTEYNFRHKVAALIGRCAEKFPELGFSDIWFMHLRHTAVTRLGESGATTAEIASITGHSLKTVEDILERYLIRTSKMARNAFQKRLDAEAADTKTGNETGPRV